MLPKKIIEEFKRFYVKNYGIGLLDKETTRRANNLTGFYGAVYGDAQFGRVESNPEQQEYDKKSP